MSLGEKALFDPLPWQLFIGSAYRLQPLLSLNLSDFDDPNHPGVSERVSVDDR